MADNVRHWTEPAEDGCEYFIPMDAAKRARSLEMWKNLLPEKGEEADG